MTTQKFMNIVRFKLKSDCTDKYFEVIDKTNFECLLSASALSNIAAHSSKVLSILKVNTEVTEQDIKKGANFPLL